MGSRIPTNSPAPQRRSRANPGTAGKLRCPCCSQIRPGGLDLFAPVRKLIPLGRCACASKFGVALAAAEHAPRPGRCAGDGELISAGSGGSRLLRRPSRRSCGCRGSHSADDFDHRALTESQCGILNVVRLPSCKKEWAPQRWFRMCGAQDGRNVLIAIAVSELV